MATDRIEREILIDAPPERVWATLTQADHLTRWFGDSAEVDLRQGGEINLCGTDCCVTIPFASLARRTAR